MLIDLDEKDLQYIEEQVKNGTAIDQAIAQLEVLKGEGEFKNNLKIALSDTEIRVEIKKIVYEGSN